MTRKENAGNMYEAAEKEYAKFKDNIDRDFFSIIFLYQLAYHELLDFIEREDTI